MGQTVMSQIQIFNKRLNTKKYRSLGGNFYRILKRTICVKPYSIFSKDAGNRNKIRTFDGNLQRILERTIWVGLYYLLKIDENFVKGEYGSNRIVFYDFFAVPRI